MNEKHNRPAVVIPQAYPLEVVTPEGDTYLVVGWMREAADDVELSFLPLVVSPRDPEIPGTFIGGAFRLPFGGSDYRIPGTPS